MTVDWRSPSPALGAGNEQKSSRRAMGAEERRRWSTFVRQDLIMTTISAIRSPESRGVVIFGGRGVGKSTLARSVELALADSSHVVRLYGTGLETAVPYDAWGLYLARMASPVVESPIAVIQGIADVVAADADGREVLVIVDEPGKIDTLSLGVVMHLVLSGAAKIMALSRSANDLPEDILWLLKDGLLTENTLESFTKTELQTLITMALGGLVAGSVVSALHASSGGNPLVLHTLVREQISRGHLVQQNSTWVLNRQLPAEPSTLLAELVESRLARESEQVRAGVEKMALIQRAPLSLVIDMLGADIIAELEEHDYLAISDDGKHSTSLAELHIGETIRATMDKEQKARLFKELADVAARQTDVLTGQDLLVYAAWSHDAGIPMVPEVALEAARTAVRYFDPVLALQWTSAIRWEPDLAVAAAMARSDAYSILADYPRALAELEGVAQIAQATPDIAVYAQWLAALTGMLLWADDGVGKVPDLIAGARARIAATTTAEPEKLLKARRTLDLALGEYQVHSGLLAEAAATLEAGYLDTSDISHRLNCGNLLVTVWGATGRELDAVALARDVEAEIQSKHVPVRNPDYYMHGLVLSLIWSGLWRESVAQLEVTISSAQRSSEYRGGILELGLGLAYTYAGKGSEAIDILLIAAAQLEIRDSYKTLRLAYSALAFAFAQSENTVEVGKYLALARKAAPTTAWVSNAMSKFFVSMAKRWMDDPEAPEELAESATLDEAAGRHTMASMSLFAASMNGQEKLLRKLVEVAAKRQGPMAELSVLLANASLNKDAGQALEAASMAQDLDLAAVESRCAVVALDFARAAGDSRRAREAETRIGRLLQAIPVMPLMPQSEGVKLTQRELQVAKLAGRGMGNRAIADRMGVSVRTVEGHLYQVFAKLGISSRNELA